MKYNLRDHLDGGQPRPGNWRAALLRE